MDLTSSLGNQMPTPPPPICVAAGKREHCSLKREWDVRERSGGERNSSYYVTVHFPKLYDHLKACAAGSHAKPARVGSLGGRLPN